MDNAKGFTVISKGLDSAREYIFGSDTEYGKLLLNIFDNGDWTNRIGQRFDTPLTSDEGSWIHIAGTYDGSRSHSGIKLYKNGQLLTTSDNSMGSYAAMHNHAETAVIGRIYNDLSFYSKGLIDEVAITTIEY